MYIDRTGQSRQRSRVLQKRTWLNRLLCLGAGMTVSVAGGVAHAYDGVTLPTQVHSDTPIVRSNPFVSSPNGPVVSGGKLIRQTSDLQLSDLQLKSIGTAVGLVPIGNPRPAGPVLEVSQPNQPKVRVNPLATKPATGLALPVIGLVEDLSVLPSDVIPVPGKNTEVAQQSRTRILGLKYIESLTPGMPLDTTVPTDVTVSEETASVPVAAIAVADPITKPTEITEASSEEDESVGVSFSFSDLAADDADMSVEAPDKTDTLDLEPESESIDLADGLLIPPPSEVPIHSESVQLAKTDESEAMEQSDEGVIGSLPLLPSPNPAWTKHTNVDSSYAVNESNAIRYPERRRAHVEVGAPPMISFREESDQNGKIAARVDPTRVVPAKLAGFRVKSAEVAKSLSPEKHDAAADRKKVDPIADLNAKIRKSCPTARLQITEVKGKMLVRGICATQEEATEVIRMIRNEFLVPVDDQIVIR